MSTFNPSVIQKFTEVGLKNVRIIQQFFEVGQSPASVKY
jgi:hypothetical protein